MLSEHHYVTYFDSGYLPRGLLLIKSLRDNGDSSQIWILALDQFVFDTITSLQLPNVSVFSENDLENCYPQLRDVKNKRTRMEYVFTRTPFVMKYVAEHQNNQNAVVIYLDADLYFTGNPESVIKELAEYSIGIIPHAYSKRLASKLAKYGKYNVGWVGIKNNFQGMQCLNWWSQKCLEWCGDTPKDGAYADQGYLDQFEEKFDGVKILRNPGFNLAPWNDSKTKLVKTNREIFISPNIPLVFFHVHGLKKYGKFYVNAELVYRHLADKSIREFVYRTYCEQLEEIQGNLQSNIPLIKPKRGVGLRGLFFRTQKQLFVLISILLGNFTTVETKNSPNN